MTPGTSEWKILRTVFGPIQVNTLCRKFYNNEVYSLHKDTDVFTHIKLRILEQVGHIYRMDRLRTQIKISEGKRYWVDQ
jgi:hypothetical protein